MLSTRVTPGRQGGGFFNFVRGLLTIISFVFDTFNVRLFCFAHTEMCSSSSATKWEFTDGTIRYESSAYLLSSSKSCNTLKSLALMTYAKGPIPEPWTMLALMSKNTDVFPLNLVQCCLSSRKSKSQLCAKSWIGNLALFSRSVECRTVSNALEKSKARRWTYGYSWRSLVSWWVRFINAHVVDPVTYLLIFISLWIVLNLSRV